MQDYSFLGQQPKKHSKIPVVILSTLLVVTVIFAGWAFVEMLDYKNNSDKKSEEAVKSALAEQKVKLDAEYEEKAKSPFESYLSGAELGSLTLSYPKNFELYVDEKTSGSSSTIEGYAHPGYVPSLSGDTAFALRFQVTARDYAAELKAFDSDIKSGSAKVSPFRLEQVPSVLGARVEGEVSNNKTGVLYLFPLRDKTIKIWTESNTYSSDLESVIKTVTFIP